jgi:hypothetical protein
MAAYNNGNPEPLIATFHKDVRHIIVELGRTYRGREEVSALAREGTGQTRFNLQEVISNGPLIAFTYTHHNPLAGMSYDGPGMAVQKYDDDGLLLAQWAYRA